MPSLAKRRVSPMSQRYPHRSVSSRPLRFAALFLGVAARSARRLRRRLRLLRSGPARRLSRAPSDRARAGADDARRLSDRRRARSAVGRQHSAPSPNATANSAPGGSPFWRRPAERGRDGTVDRPRFAGRWPAPACAATSAVGSYPVADRDARAPVRLVFQGLKAKVPTPCGQWPDDLASGGSSRAGRTSPTRISAARPSPMLAAQVDDPARPRRSARAERPRRRRHADAGDRRRPQGQGSRHRLEDPDHADRPGRRGS